MTFTDPISVVKQVFSEASAGNIHSVIPGMVNPLANSLALFRQDFPDAAWTVNTALASGDLVGFHYTGTGTDKSSGKKLSWTGSGVARVANAVLTDVFSLVEDTIGRNLLLGKLPAVGAGGVSGRWVGTAANLMALADVLQAESGGITGILRIEAVGKFTLSGSRAGNAVQIVGQDAAGNFIRFSGTVDHSVITGTLQGLSDPVRLVRL